MKRFRLVHATVLALAAMPLTGCSYNKFVSQEEAIKAQWAQVENQLQRRNDLIPNLVETVKGYAAHEEASTRTSPTRARGCSRRSRRKKRSRPRTSRPSALGRLLAVVENYPQLKAERAVQPADGRTRRHREPPRRRAHALQRAGAAITTRSARAVPVEPDGEDVQVQGISVLRGARRSQAGAEGELRPLTPPIEETASTLNEATTTARHCRIAHWWFAHLQCGSA